MDLIFHLTYLFNDFFLTTLIKCFSTLLWFGSINKTESNRPSTGLVTSQPSSHSALESVALCHCGSPRGIALQVNKYWPEASSRKLAWLIAVATLSQHSCTWWTTVETLLTDVLLPCRQSHALSPTVRTGLPRYTDWSVSKWVATLHNQEGGPSFSHWH